MRRASIAVAVALLLVAPLAAGDVLEASAKPRYRHRTTRVAPGVKLVRILDRRGPNRIRVLEVKPSRKPTVDMSLAWGTLPGLERTTDIAKRRGAIAAINGSVFLPWGRPAGIFAADGDLEATPLLYGNAFSISQDELSTYFGHPRTDIEALVIDTGEVWRLHAWNEDKLPNGKIGVYTNHGGSNVKPPVGSCSARLYRASPKAWGPGQVGVQRDYRVDAVQCRYQRMPRRGGVVVAARRSGRQSDAIASLLPGQSVRLSWSVGWRQALDITAGNPLLMENGRNVGYRCAADFCDRHPRTAIGVRGDGTLLFVTVDGRRKKWSIGMTPLQLANLFERLNARWAVNLDGGGSTTMVVRGRIVNRPSDRRERPVASAIVVLGGRDKGEKGPAPYSPPPEPTPTPTPTLLPTPPPTEGVLPTVTPSAFDGAGDVLLDGGRASPLPRAGGSGRWVLRDPASTGGLLQAISEGELGGPTQLPDSLMRFVRVFRRSRH